MPQEVAHYQCSYVYDSAPVHAKVYVWLKGDEPVVAFAGSANFTQSAFGESAGNIWWSVMRWKCIGITAV